MPARFFAVLLALVGLNVVSSAQEPQPTFRSEVSLITTDVTVLGKDRRPMRGLTAEDFIVTENGVRQTIKTFSEVVVPIADKAGATWVREAGVDVATNSSEARRLVVILMNDATMGVDRGQPKSAKAIAHSIVDHLGPDDLAAVVHAYLGRMENFTTDRLRLRAAIDAFTPQGYNTGGPPLACAMKAARDCTLDTLIRLGDVLRSGPSGRKIVFLITQPTTFSLMGVDTLTALGPVRDAFESLQAANATVYELDPRGLMTTGAVRTDEIGFADGTGGRLIRNTNAPDELVSTIFEEASSYYLIGYESSNTRADGRFRRTRVEVRPRGLTVIARRGYYGQTAQRPGGVTAATETPEEALGRVLPGGALPLRASAVAVGVPGRAAAEVVAVVGLREPPEVSAETPDNGALRRVNLVTAAFDADWRPSGGQRHDIDLRLRPESTLESEYEVTTRLSLPPGRYELRVGAERLGRTGNVRLTLDVPDFVDDELSMSGLVVGTSRQVFSGGAEVADVLPVSPTTRRLFRADENADVFARVYQGGSRPLQSATVTSEIKDTNDAVVQNSAVILTPADFDGGRSADYRAELPIGALPAGDYLLTVTVSLGERTLERSLRFAIAAE